MPKTGEGTLAAVPEKKASRGITVIAGPDGEVRGISVSPVAKLYAVVDQVIKAPAIIALPTEQRFALAGKAAAVPSEHARLVERLASNVATFETETGALNALYLFETFKELVPGFKDAVPEGRLEKAAELSPHPRVQAAVTLGEKPQEWARAAQESTPSVILLDGEDEEDTSLIGEAGRAVGDATKFVGGGLLGGVGLVTDTLGVTEGAEDTLADAAEEAVDMVGDSVNAVVDGFDKVVDGLDDGISGTARDIQVKGVAGTLGDGMADAVDMVTDFVGDTVHGIAGGVRGALDFLTGEQPAPSGQLATHKVAIVIAELFGEERSLGLRLENRVVTKFTKPEAEKLGWRLGDCVVAVGAQVVRSQDEMLQAIGVGKEALKASGTALRFIVERLGEKPAGPKKGDLIFVSGRAARIAGFEQGGSVVVQFQDDGSVARVPGNLK